MTADTRPPPKRNSSNRPPPRCSIRHVSPAHRIWPDVPFSENDAAKAAGARTDPISRREGSEATALRRICTQQTAPLRRVWTGRCRNLLADVAADDGLEI